MKSVTIYVFLGLACFGCGILVSNLSDLYHSSSVAASPELVACNKTT